MYRDPRDAMLAKLSELDHETAALRRENAAIREDLLAQRLNPLGTAVLNVYDDAYLAHLTDGERAALAHHSVTPFPVWAVGLLNLLTLGVFSLIHFSTLHDKLPRAAPNDPNSSKAIGFSFIPYFNFYWIFFNAIRLCDRLNLQFRLRGEAPKAPKGMLITSCIFTVIPAVALFIGVPIFWTISACFLQHAVNCVAALQPRLELQARAIGSAVGQ